MQEYLSDFIGKPVLTRSGECVGYVKNIQTDPKMTRARNLECCDDDEEEFLLPFSALASFGKDAAVVKSLAAAPCKNCISAPFGMPVYSAEGALLGQIDDFLRSDKQIDALLLSDGTTIPVVQLVAVTDTAIVDPSGKRKAKTRTGQKNAGTYRKKTDKTAKTEEDTFRETQNEEPFFVITAEKAPRTGEEIAATAAAASPAGKQESAADIPHLRAGRGLLTGKILPRDLKDARGNILAKAGSVVNAQTIRKAMEHDKLFELTLLCCGNANLWERFR